MAVLLSNLRVNNAVVPGNFTVRITNGTPTISWLFTGDTVIVPGTSGAIDSTINPSQHSYVVRLGTTSTNHGTNSFVGNISDTGTIVAPTMQWKYTGTLLYRGNTYYGQVQLYDAYGNGSGWLKFVCYYNQLPIVSAISLSPSLPIPTDIITVSYTYSDPDADSEGSTRIRWFRNGVHERELDGYTMVPSGHSAVGDSWTCEITPHDGHEYGNHSFSTSVTVITTSVTPRPVTDVRLVPDTPSYLDPLYAHYNYAGILPVQVRWYVTPVGQTEALVAAANDLRFYRFALNEGDQVRFTAMVETTSAPVSSPIVTVSSPGFRVFNFRIDSDPEPLALTNLTPSLSWETISPTGLLPQYLSLSIGTSPGTSNIFSQVIAIPTNSYTIPSGVLQIGNDYWVTIAASNNQTFSNYLTAHCRTAGSLWEQLVSNSTGWTVEAVVSSSTGEIHIADGTAYVAIHLFTADNNITVVSGDTIKIPANFSGTHTFTICGQEDNIKVYMDRGLVFDGSSAALTVGFLNQPTQDKFLEITGIASWHTIRYAVDGAHYPDSDSSFNQFSFESVANFVNSDVSSLTTNDDNILVGVRTADLTTDVYQYNGLVQPLTVSTVSRTSSPINRIVASPDGSYVYFCHANGATWFHGNPIVSYDQLLDFTNTPLSDALQNSPERNNWTLTTSNPSFTTTLGGSGLTIDTSTGGQWFYSQSSHGSVWFDKVNNNKGWTVDFSLKVSVVYDNNERAFTGVPDGFGIYVSDGSYYETIQFFTQEIVFFNANVTVAYDTSTAYRDYRLVGHNGMMELYARTTGTSVTLTKLASIQTSFRASTEGNASHVSVGFANDTHHAVWKDDGNLDGTQLYYSFNDTADSDGWSTPRLVVPSIYKANTPNVLAVGDKVYVVFESRTNENTTIKMIVKNAFGWGDVTTLVDTGFDAFNPKLSTDNLGMLHVVWEDYRHVTPSIYHIMRDPGTGFWSGETKINSGLYASTSPSISSSFMITAITWTQVNDAGSTDIYLAKIDTTGVSIAAPGQPIQAVGSLKLNNNATAANNSDVLIYYSTIIAVWNEVDVSTPYNTKIFTRRMTTDLDYSNDPEAITDGTYAARYPSLSLQTDGSETHYLFWQNSTAGTVYGAIHPVAQRLWTGHATVMAFSITPARTSQSITHAKVFSGVAYPCYRGLDVSSAPIPQGSNPSEVVIQLPNTFSSICSIRIASPTGPTHTVSAIDDLMISGQLPRKEFRFGSFSNAYKGKSQWLNMGMYLQTVVKPFQAGIISAETQPVTDDRSFDALVNNNGDAWLGTNSGLLFYLSQTNNIATFDKQRDDSGKIVPSPLAPDGIPIPIHHIAIMVGGTLFVSTAYDLFASATHLPNDFQSLGVPQPIVPKADAANTITDMAFDADNNLIVATDTGVSICTVATTPLISITVQKSYCAIKSGDLNPNRVLPDGYVTCVAVDGTDLWVGTNKGLAHISDGVCTVYTSQNSSLISDKITGIAIRNSTTRYIATSSGVSEMTSTSFSRLHSDDTINWNNNCRAICYVAPNTLWVSTLSSICQIQLNDPLPNRSLTYDIGSYTLGATAYDDLRTFFATIDITVNNPATGLPLVAPGTYVEVYVNARRVEAGFVVSSDNKLIQFESPLFLGDIVTLVYRNDLSLFSTLRQNHADLLANGFIDKNIVRMVTIGSNVYAQTTINGKLSLYQYNTTYNLPTAHVFLDTTPPFGVLDLKAQVGRLAVRLDIDYAYDYGSGLSTMIVSNYPNFTSDGSTPLTPVPFTNTLIHQLNNNLTSGIVSRALLPSEGTATVFGFLDNTGSDSTTNKGTMFVGTTAPAKLFRYSFADDTWSDHITVNGAPVQQLDAHGSVDFMIYFGGSMYVGVGKDGGTSTRIYSTADGIAFAFVGSVAAEHCPTAVAANSRLLIGGTLNQVGYIFIYDGVSFDTPVATGLKKIESISSYGSLLWISGAGAAGGQILNFSPVTGAFQTVWTTSDSSVSALTINSVGNTQYVYVGTSQSGKIYRRNALGGIFSESFSDIANRVARFRNGDNAVSAVIGGTIYHQVGVGNDTSGWEADSVFPHTTINDFFYFPYDSVDSKGDHSTAYQLWCISDTTIYRVQTSSDNIKVYLRLIDAAGNATPGSHNFISISVADLIGYTNVNQLLTLDPTSGEVVTSYVGEQTFVSGRKIGNESGEYYSEIFFGTNTLISWDLLSWTSITPQGTSLTLSVRSGDSPDAVLAAPWAFSFPSNLQSGVNISFLSGKYIQFKVLLTTNAAGLSPTLSQVVISSRASQASHFYTTNFTLGSTVTRGLFTATQLTPVSADIIWGFNTNNSTDFDDYQIISPDQVFVSDHTQVGEGLRIGIKFVSPTPPIYVTDVFGNTGPGGTPLMINSVTDTFTIPTTGYYTFRVSFYRDAGLTSLVHEQNSNPDYADFTINGTTMTAISQLFTSGNTVSVLYIPPTSSGLICSPQADPTYYYVKVELIKSSVVISTESAHSFVTACNPSFYDNIVFTFTPSQSNIYSFRSLMYGTASRSGNALNSYFSGVPWTINSTGSWTIIGGAFSSSTVIPVGGVSLVSGTQYTITLHPPSTDMKLGQDYYLTLQSYNNNAGVFTTLSQSFTFRVTDPVADITCGVNSNVPVVKGFAISFELKDKRLVTLNL